MANEPDRPTTTWKRGEPQRPTIQRPAPERPTIDRPTIDIQRPTVQRPAPERPTVTLGDTPAASPAQRPAPTPTQGRQDNGSHPGRKTDRSAHTSRLASVMATHVHNNEGFLEEYEPATAESAQEVIDGYRMGRHRLGYDEDMQGLRDMLEDSFKNRHNKDYAFEDFED